MVFAVVNIINPSIVQTACPVKLLEPIFYKLFASSHLVKIPPHVYQGCAVDLR